MHARTERIQLVKYAGNVDWSLGFRVLSAGYNVGVGS